MVIWSSSAEILRDSGMYRRLVVVEADLRTDAFEKLIFACFGCFTWEICTTFNFEISLITRRRRFRWPLGTCLRCPLTCLKLAVFFFLSRYCMLLSFVGLIISLTTSHPINCGALFLFNSWTGNMAILSSSTSLMLRTVALWDRKRSIVIPLGLLSLAHWTMLYRTMFVVRAVWDESLRICVVASTNAALLNTTFFFTMGFDLVILITTAISLIARHSARTDLWKLLFQDGLVYFVITFTTNCIPAALNLLNLNAPMNVIGTIPAATVSSIAACRAVMRLLDFNSDIYVHSLSALPTSDPRQSTAPYSLNGPARFAVSRPDGVLVTREQITMAEFRTPIPVLKNSNDMGRLELEGGRRGLDIIAGASDEDDKEETIESNSTTA
ncbi:hypothetical protein MKEN_00072900 [Mycena kentingensis (nom. inval.)]|nr:hypothetical protein MKEN_00072900 [Mycena kentingensis (nom. inval.)]